jgi:hypothetical protein
LYLVARPATSVTSTEKNYGRDTIDTIRHHTTRERNTRRTMSVLQKRTVTGEPSDSRTRAVSAPDGAACTPAVVEEEPPSTGDSVEYPRMSHTAPHHAAPHRAAPHRTAPRRTAPHCTSSHCTAPHCTTGTAPRPDPHASNLRGQTGPPSTTGCLTCCLSPHGTACNFASPQPCQQPSRGVVVSGVKASCRTPWTRS